REIDGAIVNDAEIRHVADVGRHPGGQVARHARPPVDGDSPRAADVVDEVAVAGPDVEDARVRPDQALEVRLAKDPPENVAAPVVRQAGLVIVHQRARARPFHPKRIPMTMRRPILRAVQLLEAPLLWPYRAWNVTGHSTMLKPCPSAVSRKWAL